MRLNNLGGLTFRRGLAAVAATAGLLSAPALAQHGPHVHGEGRLSLAIEKNEVEIEVSLPGADVVGFEHKAETPEDKKAVAAAIAKLKNAKALFQFPAEAGCKVEKVEAEAEGMDGQLPQGHGHKEAGHGEFVAHYHFDCAKPSAAAFVDVGLFKAFPTVKAIDAATITPKGQGAQELTAAAARLRL